MGLAGNWRGHSGAGAVCSGACDRDLQVFEKEPDQGKMMNFSLKLMNFVLQMLNFVFKMVNFIFKMMNFVSRTVLRRTPARRGPSLQAL